MPAKPSKSPKHPRCPACRLRIRSTTPDRHNAGLHHRNRTAK